MKTKCEIVQELLNDKKITAEDAVVLLMSEKEYVYLNNPVPYYPVAPYNPSGPFWYADPFPGRIANDFPNYSVTCQALN